MLARYLQHEPPTRPEWGMKKMKASWQVLINAFQSTFVYANGTISYIYWVNFI